MLAGFAAEIVAGLNLLV